MVSGKSLWPCVMSSGICTRTSSPRRDLVAHSYRAHCSMEACKSHYLLYLEADVAEAEANTGHLGCGVCALCADIVESANAIVKRSQ